MEAPLHAQADRAYKSFLFLAVLTIISERGSAEADLDLSCCDFGGLRFLPLFAKELPHRDSRGRKA
jgi:hypothetical protein